MVKVKIAVKTKTTRTRRAPKKKDEAAAEAKEVLQIDPKFSVESHAKVLPYKNKVDIEREVDALRKAGLK